MTMPPQEMRESLREWQRFVVGEAHVLNRFPNLLWQQAANQPEGTISAKALGALTTGPGPGRRWLRLVNRSNVRSPCLRTLTVEGQVNALEVSCDGRCIIGGEGPSWSAPEAGSLRVWDVDTGREVRSLPVPGGVNALACLADGRRIACAEIAGAIRVRDWERGAILASFALPRPFSATKVAVSPDCSLIAGGGAQALNAPGIVVVWETSIGRQRHVLEGDMAIGALLFTPDGRHLISGGDDGHVRVWDSLSGVLEQDIEPPTSVAIGSLAIAPDGRRLAIGGRGQGGGLRLWDFETAQDTPVGERRNIAALAFFPDGRRIVAADLENRLTVFDLEGGRPLCCMSGHQGEIVDLSVLADGTRVISCSRDRTVKFWEVAAPSGSDTVVAHGASVVALRFRADATALESYGQNKTMLTWDCSTGRIVGALAGGIDLVPGIWKPVAWPASTGTPDGRRVISLPPSTDVRAVRKGPIQVWDAPSRQVIRTLGSNDMSVWRGQLEITPDGRQVLAVLSDKSLIHHTLTVWDADRGLVLRSLEMSGKIVSLQLAPDAGHVLLVYGDGGLTLLDLATLSVTRELRQRAQLARAAITPDGRRIVSAGQDRVVLVWDLSSGEPIARYVGGCDFTELALGDRLIAVGDDAGGVTILELCGAESGPDLVPLLRDGEREFWICAHCGAESAGSGDAEGRAVCGRCGRISALVRTPGPVERIPAGGADPQRTEEGGPATAGLCVAQPERVRRVSWFRRWLT